MRAGAWGLSTSFLDVDAQGRPVPSRVADGAEFDALLDVLGARGRGLVEFVPGLLGPDARDRRRGAGPPLRRPRHPAHLDGLHLHPEQPGVHPALARPGRPAARRGHPVLPAALAAHRRLPAQLGLVDDVHVDARGLAPGHRGPRRRQGRAAARPGVARHGPRRVGPHREGDVPAPPHRDGALRRGRRRRERAVARPQPAPTSSPNAAAIRPTCFADFVLANDCRPGIVAVGMANADVEGVARTLADPHVLISSSDAGAHVQMLCASGDTTLLLTRHVRERGDFTLEEAVVRAHRAPGRRCSASTAGAWSQAGNVADLAVFALDELHYDDDEFVERPARRRGTPASPEGGYRATIVAGTAVQESGKMTGALPGRVISVHD